MIPTDAAGGVPYALQLIGWNACDVSDGDVINRRTVESILPIVHTKLETGLGVSVDVSPGRFALLDAMADDTGPSEVGDVCRRLGKAQNQISPTRAWLINHGYIEALANPPGWLRFAHPGYRAVVRTHRHATVERDVQRTSIGPNQRIG